MMIRKTKHSIATETWDFARISQLVASGGAPRTALPMSLACDVDGSSQLQFRNGNCRGLGLSANVKLPTAEARPTSTSAAEPAA